MNSNSKSALIPGAMLCGALFLGNSGSGGTPWLRFPAPIMFPWVRLSRISRRSFGVTAILPKYLCASCLPGASLASQSNLARRNARFLPSSLFYIGGKNSSKPILSFYPTKPIDGNESSWGPSE
jgi:hypothetical protein